MVSGALGRPAKFDAAKAFRLRDHDFYHGNAAVDGRVALFFYFQEANTGILALIPGVRGAMEVARFKVSAGLADSAEELRLDLAA